MTASGRAYSARCEDGATRGTRRSPAATTAKPTKTIETIANTAITDRDGIFEVGGRESVLVSRLTILSSQIARRSEGHGVPLCKSRSNRKASFPGIFGD